MNWPLVLVVGVCFETEAGFFVICVCVALVLCYANPAQNIYITYPTKGFSSLPYSPHARPVCHINISSLLVLPLRESVFFIRQRAQNLLLMPTATIYIAKSILQILVRKKGRAKVEKFDIALLHFSAKRGVVGASGCWYLRMCSQPAASNGNHSSLTELSRARVNLFYRKIRGVTGLLYICCNLKRKFELNLISYYLR